MSDKPFSGQRVIITGGGTGIGRAAALAFAEQGAEWVLVTGRRTEPLAESAAAHPAICAVVADVGTEEGAETVAGAVTEGPGTADILIHNAGVLRPSRLGDCDVVQVRALFDTNVLGPLILTNRMLPLLRSPGASVLLLSSVVGHRPALPGTSAYAASKAAVESFVRSWALELAGLGIRVNGVAPGSTRTQAMPSHLTPEQVTQAEARLKQMIPAGRRADPGEIVTWITQVSDPRSGFLTGQVITVDGGQELTGFPVSSGHQAQPLRPGPPGPGREPSQVPA